MAQKIYYPNYPYNDLNDDVYLSSSDVHYDFNNYNTNSTGVTTPPAKHKYDNNRVRFTFHSPETHFRKPKLGNILKYEAEVFGKAKGFFNRSQDFAKYRLLSEKHYQLAKSYASFISSTVTSPTDEALAGIVGGVAGQAAGAVGAAAGVALGVPGLGQITGAIGGFVGSLIGSNVGKNSFSSQLFRNTSYMMAVEKMLGLFELMNEAQQYNYQHQSVGKYNQIITNTPRRDFVLAESEYLTEGKQTVKDFNTNILFNNQDRESSVYFKTELPRPNYSVIDNSRLLISENTSLASGSTSTVQYSDLHRYKFRWYKGDYVVDYLDCNGELQFKPFTTGAFRTWKTDYIECSQGIVNITHDPLSAGDLDDLHYEEVPLVGCESCIADATQVSIYPCQCNAPTERNISSFYVSNKVYSQNQYGKIEDIQWLETQSCSVDFSNPTDCDNMFFGGDTFINRMSLKRKHNFFIRNTFRLPDDTDFNYSLVPNVANPIYFFDTILYPKETVIGIQGLRYDGLGFDSNLKRALLGLFSVGIFNRNRIQPPNYKLDCYNNIGDVFTGSSLLFQTKPLQGLMYNYVYGIPYYIVESSINLDLRDELQEPWDRFYPKESNLDLWLQEATVPIKLDNTYHYDESFSKQSTESFNYMYDINFKGLENCKTEHPQRVIYSGQSLNIDDSNYSDNYLVNKALDYYDFPKSGGRITSIESIEGDRILIGQEDTSYIYSSTITLNTDINTVLLSTGSIFNSKPQQYSSATNGYFGTQHKQTLHTPFGHIRVDAKRGGVFLLGNGGQGLEEISNKGLRHWFKENLPFKINKQFKDINIDDNYNGIGIAMVYDKRFNQLFLTKLDYESKSEDVKYNYSSKLFYLESTGEIISLDNKKYFKNKCWTVSYSFYRQEWVSFHSFNPLYYVEEIDTFLAGNKEGAWQHNITNKSYQVFFNKIEPFIVETINKGGLGYDILKSVSYYADFIRYHNDFDFYYNLEESFNKAVFYGKSSNSGLLLIEPRSNNYADRLSYPKIGIDHTKVEEVIKEQGHSINQFKNRVKPDYTYLPQWINDSNNVDKKLNFQSLIFSNSLSNDYIRDSNIKIRLIQDIETRYKIIFKGATLDLENSFR